jgi:hypothetical protein
MLFELTAYIAEDEAYNEFWNMLLDEYRLSKEMVLLISGYRSLMEEEPVSKKSIEIRERIVLPLLVIQQYALQKIEMLVPRINRFTRRWSSGRCTAISTPAEIPPSGPHRNPCRSPAAYRDEGTQTGGRHEGLCSKRGDLFENIREKRKHRRNTWDNARFVLADLPLDKRAVKKILPLGMWTGPDPKATLFICHYPEVSYPSFPITRRPCWCMCAPRG